MNCLSKLVNGTLHFGWVRICLYRLGFLTAQDSCSSRHHLRFLRSVKIVVLSEGRSEFECRTLVALEGGHLIG